MGGIAKRLRPEAQATTEDRVASQPGTVARWKATLMRPFRKGAER
jgi:hypothetical protein